MSVYGDIRGVAVVWRSVDDADGAPLGHFRCDL
jgi:hypothetical protein